MIGNINQKATFRHHVFDHASGSFYSTLKCHKIGAKVCYCIRIPALIIIIFE